MKEQSQLLLLLILKFENFLFNHSSHFIQNTIFSKLIYNKNKEIISERIVFGIEDFLLWAMKESDLRPLSYQDSVLPLNYTLIEKTAIKKLYQKKLIPAN